MHELFGEIPDKLCEDCTNLIQGRCNTRYLRKCVIYGATHSEATDWRKKYTACGMFNREWKGGKIIDACKSVTERRNLGLERTEPLEGQYRMEEVCDLN